MLRASNKSFTICYGASAPVEIYDQTITDFEGATPIWDHIIGTFAAIVIKFHSRLPKIFRSSSIPLDFQHPFHFWHTLWYRMTCKHPPLHGVFVACKSGDPTSTFLFAINDLLDTLIGWNGIELPQRTFCDKVSIPYYVRSKENLNHKLKQVTKTVWIIR